MISKEFRKALEDNKINIDYKLSSDIIQCKRERIITAYKNEGYSDINETLIKFLCYFMDREILFRNGSESMHFKLIRSLKITYAVKTIESAFNLKKLIPFGMLYREHMNLFIDENDRVYANMDNISMYFGNNPFDALINILNDNPIERVEI